VVILVAWAGALGWLVRREYFRSSSARLAEAALSVSPGAQFYRLSLGAQQLGYASTTVDTLVDSIRVVDVLVIDVPALGRLHRTEARSAATLDRGLQLRGLQSEVDGAGWRFEVQATPAPEGSLVLALTSRADSLTTTISTGPVELPSVWPLRLAFGRGLKTGRTATAQWFDPFTLQARKVTLQVAAESTLVVPDSADYDSTTMAWVPVHFDTVRAFRLDGAPDGLRVWIDAQGRVVRAGSPRGFSLERTAFELAYENFRRRDTLRLMRATAAPAAGEVVPITATAAGVRPDARLASLRLRLGGGALDGLDLAGGRQRLAGDTLTIATERGAALVARYRLPNGDAAMRDALLPAPLMESGDLRVAAQARLIAAGDRDPRQAVERLTHWIAATVRDDTTGELSGAVGVLSRRRGAANDRVVLFVAMARALGVPARPVAGLLYARGRFYYHAWAEVYLGDWVAVDPTFDQLPADAAHVRLAIGAFARPLELVRLLGRLTLEVP
jgi:transglutaminase-like putative cysteine protease